MTLVVWAVAALCGASVGPAAMPGQGQVGQPIPAGITLADAGNETLRAKLQQKRQQGAGKAAPAIRALMDRAAAELRASGIVQRAVTVGDQVPDFVLPDATGQPTSLRNLLAHDPVVLTFYRGSWCPYCNLALRALQERLADIRALGATLVAVSPETPDSSLTIRERQHLTFPVLSDQGNGLSSRLGLVLAVPAYLRPVYAKIGIDLVKANGDERYELPLPATYVIDRQGVVRYAFVDTDYTQRAEPADILAVLRNLAGRP